jgi:hypothetical protein
MSKILIASGVATFLFVSAVATATVGRAQSVREADIIGFHQLCEKGDRKACVRFGILIGENRECHFER